MTSEKQRHPSRVLVPIGLLAAATAALGWLVMRLLRSYRYGAPGTHDFIQYWTTGQLLRSGENPYDATRLFDLQRQLGSPYRTPVLMWNPPWLLVWLYPLLHLSFEQAALVWLVLNTGIILLSAALIWRAIAGEERGRSALVAMVACLPFVPIYFALRMGQMSSLLLLAMAVLIYAAPKRRDLLAGAALALATVKPHVVYLIWIGVAWWTAAGKRWRILLGLAIVLVPTLGLLTLLWPTWLTAYQETLSTPPLYWRAPVLGGVLRVLSDNRQPYVQFVPPLLGVGALVFWLVLRRPALRWRSHLAPLLLLSVPTAAYGWPFDHAVLLVPHLAIVRWLAQGRGGARRRILVATLLAATLAGTLAVNLLRLEEFAFFWVPWALGAAYLGTRPWQPEA